MKRPSKPTIMIAAGTVLVAASAGLGAAKLMEAQHPTEHVPSTAFGSAPSPGGGAPSGVTPQVAHQPWCEITTIPGWKHASRAIEKSGDAIANTVARYGDVVTQPLPPGKTAEMLAAAARAEIEQDRARLNKQLDEALAGIAAGGIPDWHAPEGRGAVGPCPDGK